MKLKGHKLLFLIIFEVGEVGTFRGQKRASDLLKQGLEVVRSSYVCTGN